MFSYRQISKIQAEHDRVAGELSVKKNRLQDKINFFDELTKQIFRLVQLLKEEDDLFNKKIEEIQNQKEGLKNNKDLSPAMLEKSLKELDGALMRLYHEHEAVSSQLKIQLSVKFCLDFAIRVETTFFLTGGSRSNTDGRYYYGDRAANGQ